MAAQAGFDAVRAVTLNDEQVIRLAVRVAERSDRKHVLAPPDHPHTRRLQKLTNHIEPIDGKAFSFKVYLSPKVNAFAMADGSIRLYSGLMDLLEDDELQFVIGHEMGHVVKKHIKNKIRLAYAGSAVRKAIASQQNEAGEIARSTLGALAQSLLNAQYSQQEEREADDYGVEYLQQKGYGQQPAISALLKLATLGNDHSFLSSHPAPEARAQRLRQKALSPPPVQQVSLPDRIMEWLMSLWPFEKDPPQT
jgi:putative metalloprotease